MCWYDTREVCDKSHLCKLHFLEPALHRWPPPGWFQFHTWSWESQLWGDVLYGDQGTCKFNINKSVGEGVGGRKEESPLSWLSPCPLTFSHRAGKTLPHLLILSGELKCFITAGRSYWRGGCFSLSSVWKCAYFGMQIELDLILSPFWFPAFPSPVEGNEIGTVGWS